MPWVEFTNDFNWRPKANVIVAFKRGLKVFVTRRCAQTAIEAGKAVITVRPRDNVASRQPDKARSR